MPTKRRSRARDVVLGPFDQLGALFNRIEPEPNTGCWLWTGRQNRQGYGSVRIPGSDGHCTMAHRLVYSRLRGAIPNGLTLDHLCRVKSCVNPNHLEPVTLRVNIERAKRRAPSCGHGGYGTPHPNGRGYLARRCRECRRLSSIRNHRKRSFERCTRRLADPMRSWPGVKPNGWETIWRPDPPQKARKAKREKA